MMMMGISCHAVVVALLALSSANGFAIVKQPFTAFRSHVLFMGWGPEPIWTGAKVISNEKANKSGTCVSINVDLDPEVAKEYTVPGQYVQVRLNEATKPLFLAIASPPLPDSNSFEFLIKSTPDNEWMTAAASGTELQISQVLGAGFPIQENLEGMMKFDNFPTQNILLLGVGSGVAPLKAAVESGQLGLPRGRTARLYYGVRTPDDLCFVESFAKWEEAGIEVVPVLSQPPDVWEGRTGYVQTALEEDGVPIPRNCCALLCGMKGMTESVKAILLQAGVFEGRILTNF